MKNSVEIEKIDGGYILIEKTMFPKRQIIVTTEQLFEKLLQMFEGRADCFHGDMYGKVTINREEPK